MKTNYLKKNPTFRTCIRKMESPTPTPTHPHPHPHPLPTPQNLNTLLLRKFSSNVNGHAATATFACGGSIPTSLHKTPSHPIPDPSHTTAPITLRFDSPDKNGNIIAFPLPNHSIAEKQNLEDLRRASQPATFGLDGRDVLDETYRKAGKLDPGSFMTDFHPHDCGIVDSIAQVLLPGTVVGGKGVGIGPYGVRVELYKLNVCMFLWCVG